MKRLKEAGDAAIAAGDAKVIAVRQPWHALAFSSSDAEKGALLPAGSYQEAVTAYTAALQRAKPHNIACAALYNNRSAAYEHLRQYSEALQDALAASTMRPDWDKVLSPGMWLVGSRGSCRACQSHAAHCASVPSSLSVWLMQAIFRQVLAYIGLKQYGQAMLCCRAGLARCPDSRELLEMEGVLGDLQQRAALRQGNPSSVQPAAGTSALDDALLKLKQAGVLLD